MKKILSVLLVVALFVTMSTTAFAQDVIPSSQQSSTTYIDIKAVNTENVEIKGIAELIFSLNLADMNNLSVEVRTVPQGGTDLSKQASNLKKQKMNNDIKPFYVPSTSSDHEYIVVEIGKHELSGDLCNLSVATFYVCKNCEETSGSGNFEYKSSHKPGSITDMCRN